MKIKSQGKTCRFDTLKAGDVFAYDTVIHLRLSGNDLRAVELETGMTMLFDADDAVEYYENAYCCLGG